MSMASAAGETAASATGSGQGIPEWMTAISWFDGDIHQLQTMLFEGHVFGNYVMIWCLQRVTMCLKSPGFGSFGLRNN